FNFNPATIFMGDTGSMLIGYILATTSLIGSKGGTAVALLIPILAMGVPIFDTLLAIIRRYATNQPIFSADKGHIHHRLLDMGFTHKKTVLVLYAISLLFTAAAIATYMSREDWYAGVILLSAALLVFVMMRVVGIFQIKKKDTPAGIIHDDTLLAAMDALPQFIIDTHHVTSVDELETALNAFCGQIGFIVAKCESNEQHPLTEWTWESSEGLSMIGRNYVSPRFEISDPTLSYKLTFTFGWSSEDAKVSPQLSLVFAILMKTIRAALVRIQQSLNADRENNSFS
ncbi:MAG: undecaprenyl/decaprenyl-phosphate alpha-N-acetylglucosaminyl 1-phosphate transferase, partial [Deltaproteobacteria bacterium]|nr:undecaprenyl/decaprenyl-phosphate alpha-N-acetylglucosaminyl 1-phosphate transferase [Deltaproteobacteria bacterium]